MSPFEIYIILIAVYAVYLRIPQVSGRLGAKIQFRLSAGEALKRSTTRNGADLNRRSRDQLSTRQRE